MPQKSQSQAPLALLATALEDMLDENIGLPLDARLREQIRLLDIMFRWALHGRERTKARLRLALRAQEQALKTRLTLKELERAEIFLLGNGVKDSP